VAADARTPDAANKRGGAPQGVPQTTATAPASPAASTLREGDRCGGCGYWWWERDEDRGPGWHSLVPISYADTPELARIVACPTCEELQHGR
jgi:hypothetical protein